VVTRAGTSAVIILNHSGFSADVVMFSGRRSYATANTRAFRNRLKEAVQWRRQIADIKD
jgi:hypothetical protein